MASAPHVTEEQLEFFRKCRKDPWLFLTKCVYTLDQVDKTTPIKLFPSHLDYLRIFTLFFLRERLIAVPKSRRMTMSWACISLILWDVIFHKGRHWAMVSKKETDSEDLVRRAKFIFDHIPEELIPKALLPKLEGGKMMKSPPSMHFHEINSRIQGFPMGAEQLRQYTFSGILGDECAFWEVAQKFYASAKPTIDGGGSMILISSRAPGFFKKVVFDQIDSPDFNFPELPPAPTGSPMQGVETWKNPKNGFRIIDIHYTANPDKRSKEFRESVRQAMPVREFLMEYEKNWDTFEGMAVYPDFRKDIHISKIKEEPHLGSPLLMGVDFGLTPALVIAQMRGQCLYVFREYTATNMGIKQFMAGCLPKVFQEFPEWNIGDDKSMLWFIDPAGFAKSQIDARTCVQEMKLCGINNITAGPMDWESRRSSVEQFLLHVDRDGYGMQINQAECPQLVEAFQGGYRYPESFGEIEPSRIRPVKDRFSHVSDAFQYLCGGIRRKNLGSSKINLKAPYYQFTSDNETGDRYGE